MLLSYVLDELINTELADLSIGKPKWSKGPVNYKRLISSVYFAATDLHKRFLINQEEVLIETSENETMYVLKSEFAMSNTASTAAKYIIDSEDLPFNPNIIKVQQAFNAFGEMLPINDLNNPWSLFTPKPNVIQLPYVSRNTAQFSVVCRTDERKPVFVNYGSVEGVELDIPVTFLEPLILYAAGRIYSSRGATNEGINEGASFMARYEQSCARIERYGLTNRDSPSNLRLIQKGWV